MVSKLEQGKEGVNPGEIESLEEWREFTELQKKIILKHFSDPELSKIELAKDLGVQPHVIYHLFNSKYFQKVNIELANLEKRDLLQLAIRTLRKLMLSSKSDMVKLAACTKVLEDSEVLGTKTKQRPNEKILVVWGQSANNKYSIPTTSEAIGNTPGFPQIQSGGGGSEIRENNLIG